MVGKLISTPKLAQQNYQIDALIFLPRKLNRIKTNTCEAQEKILKDLFEWQEGDFHPSLEVNKGDYGWGMYAKADVPSDTTILSITREHGINIETAIETILR